MFLEYIGVFCVKRGDETTCIRFDPGLKVKVVGFRFVSFHPVPMDAVGGYWSQQSSRVWFERRNDKHQSLIDVHIGHDSSVGVCFSKRYTHRIASGFRCGIFPRFTVDGRSVAISF